MSQFARGFSTSAQRLMRFIGSPMSEIITTNGVEGLEFERSIHKVTGAIEEVIPNITTGNIQGSKAHLSSKDPGDKKPVITVGLKTAQKDIGALHVHSDGTFKFFPNRAGQQAKYDLKIRELPGYIPHNKEDGSSAAEASK